MTRKERKPENGDRRRNGSGFRWNPLRRLTQPQRLLLLTLLAAALLALIIVPKGGFVADHYNPGDIASRDIKAPRELLFEDRALTDKKRDEAEIAVLPLYDFDAGAGQQTAQQLRRILALLVQHQQAEAPDAEAARRLLAEHVDLPPDVEILRRLLARPLADLPQEALLREVVQTLSVPLVGNLKLFQAESGRGIVLRDLAGQRETVLEQATQVIGLGEALDRLKLVWVAAGLEPKTAQALSELLQPQVRPNLTFNRNETEERRQTARRDVTPVLQQVKKGEMIVREGDRITPEQILKLRELRELGKDSRLVLHGIGLFMVILALFCVTHLFAQTNIRKFKPAERDLVFLAGSTLSLFVLLKIAIFTANALETALPAIESSSYYYLIPFAMGAMLVRLVLNSETALVFTLVLALLVGALFGNSLALALYVAAGSLIGAHGLRHCKQRSSLYRAGLQVALVNMVLILAIHFIAGKEPDLQLLYKLLFGLCGGLLSAMMVNGTVPLVESLFKYTTDIRLLEMANLNSPVLRELMIQAPGTYHHSVVVGNLVESAAEAISANPLMARVAAYYHDIGKIRKPLYFIENAEGQENRHDKLAPSMSALILTAHVKDGVEMAREHHLGQELIEIIQQHHGTGLIKFFYDKARSLTEPNMPQVKESDYRYPGPKPQTREAALIMLADAVEAASRTLSEPTPARIQGMVQKIINNIFIDGQLDECELTLKDLHRIAKSFNRILSGIFHNRIDYPEPAFKERDKDATRKKDKESDDSDREPADEPRPRDTDAGKGGTEDLKRLGMS